MLNVTTCTYVTTCVSSCSVEASLAALGSVVGGQQRTGAVEKDIHSSELTSTVFSVCNEMLLVLSMAAGGRGTALTVGNSRSSMVGRGGTEL